MTKQCTIGCDNCPLCTKYKGLTIFCKLFEFKHPEKAVEIVERWEKISDKNIFI